MKPASMSSSSPVRSSRTRAPVTAAAVAVQVHDAVIGEHARAVRGGAARERRRRSSTRRSTRPARRTRADAGVQPRLAAQRLGDRDLLDRQRSRAAALEEAVAVGRIVVGRGHEQPAGVLDAVRASPAQHRVLVHALLGRDRVLYDVAPARVQQAVEAPARALGEVGALDQHASKPRKAASQATPTPVAPPPITSRSACKLVTSLILRVVGAEANEV